MKTGQDSILNLVPVTAIDTATRQTTRPQTPYQVLRLLPKDATPAQQDSAIQAWLKPAEIRYSEQPDTLHLPGEEVPRDLKAVSIPQYYKENFFSNNSMYHEELQSDSYGVAGDPVPYVINNDDVITGLLLLCFLFIAFTLSRISGFIVKQLKDFFYFQREDRVITETGNEMKFQLVFLGLTCLVYGLMYYLYTTTYISETYILPSEYALLGIFVGVFALYILLHFGLYHVVNTVFFDSRRSKKFLTSILFLIAMEGALLFPVVLMFAYLHFSALYAIYCTVIVLVLVKILTFYKSYIIFFKQNDVFLQNILYFCALEIVPLFALLGGLSVIVDIFKVKF
jgi:hypothetical protein